AINQTYNEESFLHLRGEILAEIELFWMLPHQRRKKTWFPEALYYEASVYELKKYVKNLKDEQEDEILQNLLPKIKEIAEFKDDDEILKNLLPEIKSNLLPEIKKIIENKDSTKDSTEDSSKDLTEDSSKDSTKDSTKDSAQDWPYSLITQE
ncbi:28361_t:CDS:2, partial [Racocetra persica]